MVMQSSPLAEVTEGQTAEGDYPERAEAEFDDVIERAW